MIWCLGPCEREAVHHIQFPRRELVGLAIALACVFTFEGLASEEPRPLFVEGYAGRVSYAPGEELTLHVSTTAANFAVDMDNEVVAGIDGVKLAVHLCRRAGARARGEAAHRGGYGPILRQLGRLHVDHITMEFTSPGAGEMSVFRHLPEHVEIGLGCVSCQPGQIDSVETIVSRVEAALEHVAPARITLNPDCGFAPGSAADVSLDEVYTKLRHQVLAAQRLRERHG